RDQLVDVLLDVDDLGDDAVRITRDQAAELRCPLVATRGNRLRAERTDGILDRDVEVVDRQLQATEEVVYARPHDEAGRPGICHLRAQVRVRPGDGHRIGLQAVARRIVENAEAGGLGPEQLTEIRCTDVARTRRAQAQRVGRLPDDAGLPGRRVDARGHTRAVAIVVRFTDRTVQV